MWWSVCDAYGAWWSVCEAYGVWWSVCDAYGAWRRGESDCHMTWSHDELCILFHDVCTTPSIPLTPPPAPPLPAASTLFTTSST